MSRTKQYDRGDLLDRAIEVFRLQGFNGTSTAELVDALGVNRKTMYVEFGSKLELFDAVLQRYNEENLTRVIGPVEAPDAGSDAIRSAFDSYAQASGGWARGRGCLLCNTASDRGALDPTIGSHVDAYFDRLTRAFRHALENAVAAGDIEPDADLEALAAFLTTALVGVAASIRAEAPPHQVAAACRVATSVLD